MEELTNTWNLYQKALRLQCYIVAAMTYRRYERLEAEYFAKRGLA